MLGYRVYFQGNPKHCMKRFWRRVWNSPAPDSLLEHMRRVGKGRPSNHPAGILEWSTLRQKPTMLVPRMPNIPVQDWAWRHHRPGAGLDADCLLEAVAEQDATLARPRDLPRGLGSTAARSSLQRTARLRMEAVLKQAACDRSRCFVEFTEPSFRFGLHILTHDSGWMTSPSVSSTEASGQDPPAKPSGVWKRLGTMMQSCCLWILVCASIMCDPSWL